MYLKSLLMTTAEAESRLYNDPFTRFKHSVQDNNNKCDHSIGGKIDSKFYYSGRPCVQCTATASLDPATDGISWQRAGRTTPCPSVRRRTCCT